MTKVYDVEKRYDFRVQDTGTVNQTLIGFRQPDGVVYYSMVPEDFTVLPTREYNRLVQASGSLPSPTPEENREALFRKFHAVGRKAYGVRWDAQRQNICSIVSFERTGSSKDLSISELETAIQMMEVVG